MTIEEAIHARHSVRTYSPVMPDRTVLDYINSFIAGLKPIFPGTTCRLVLIEKAVDGKIGTYGVVRGAQCYIAVLNGREGDLQAVNAGVCAEQLVLGLTQRGIGTVWIGGTFSEGDVSRAVKPTPDEIVEAIIPFGFPASKESITSRLFSAISGSKNRKPFDELFSIGPDSPFRKGLELMRLAPSAQNKQDWRAVEADGMLHFFTSSTSHFAMLDMGIGLAHFSAAAPAGKWEKLDYASLRPKWRYVVSRTIE